jgi:spermidine/putrescine transport system substrate-binding protein
MKKIHILAAACSAFLLCCLAQAKQELNLFAWSEYIPQEVIDGFTKETGIAVNYETFASNEELLAKMIAGGSAYDLVQPTDYMAELMIREKLVCPLDKAKLPLLKYIDPTIIHLPYDPEQAYTVPFMSGSVGIVINTEKVKDPIKGYKDVFSGKYANRLVVLNDNRELVTWALAALGHQVNEVSKENLDKAREVLKVWIPQVKIFDSDSPKTALLNGEADIGIVWSGEAAILWNQDKKFAYVLPEEGAHRFIDVLAIPTNAKNKEAAHLFINYILRPEVSRIISSKFPYTNPNLEARKLLTAEELANPASYPKTGKLSIFRDIGRSAVLIDKMVTDLKSGH